MKWLNTFIPIISTGKAGACPHCKSDKYTDYAMVLLNERTRVGYCDAWCNKCKKLGHLSRVIIPEEGVKVINLNEVEKEIPKYKVTY